MLPCGLGGKRNVSHNHLLACGVWSTAVFLEKGSKAFLIHEWLGVL